MAHASVCYSRFERKPHKNCGWVHRGAGYAWSGHTGASETRAVVAAQRSGAAASGARGAAIALAGWGGTWLLCAAPRTETGGLAGFNALDGPGYAALLAAAPQRCAGIPDHL